MTAWFANLFAGHPLTDLSRKLCPEWWLCNWGKANPELKSRGFLGILEYLIRIFPGEDLWMTSRCHAAGYYPKDFNAPNEPFAVNAVGIPGEHGHLVEGGSGVLDSIKNDPR